MPAKGMQAYGIGAIRTIEEATSGRGPHGDDERIAEDAFVQLLQYLWYTVIEIAATQRLSGDQRQHARVG